MNPAKSQRGVVSRSSAYEPAACMEPESAKIRVMARRPRMPCSLCFEFGERGIRVLVMVKNWKRKRSCQKLPQKPGLLLEFGIRKDGGFITW